MNIHKYYVSQNPDEWADGQEYPDYRTAKAAAELRAHYITEVTFTFDDSELIYNPNSRERRLTEARLYFEESDEEKDGRGWNVEDDNNPYGVAARFERRSEAISFAQKHFEKHYFDEAHAAASGQVQAIDPENSELVHQPEMEKEHE